MGPKLEDFEVLSTIGSGAHGTVRRVRRRQDGQVLVWKELNYGNMTEVEKKGLVLEVNLLRELRHPNVVKFLHHVVDKRSTTLYILMEYCTGGDLKRLISRCRQTKTYLEEDFVWRILKQICQALKVCHSGDLRGGRIILHRDIKPANVFLDAKGDVKLGDFGLAKALNSDASFATTFVGTPYYMSPEVINGQEYNEKSDIWSLGCLIYELCALHPPFQGATHKELAVKIREARYENLPIQYSSELQEVLSLLLTYEDFLRPNALMILHHSALVARTSTKQANEEDPLYSSLSPSVLLSNKPDDKQKETATSEGESKNKAPAETVNRVEVSFEMEEPEKEKVPTGEEFRLSAINKKGFEGEEKGEIDVDDGEIKSTGAVPARSAVYDGSNIDDALNLEENKVKLSISLSDTVEEICRAARENHSGERNRNFDSLDSGMIRLDCACGGISLKEWRGKLAALREAETAMLSRELSIKEREHDVIQRERRVAAMEREAREHLVRAQIYLRQSRPRRNATTSPGRPPSDLDTTMSADIGEIAVSTVTKLDPERIENPFLKMRGVQQVEKKVSFSKNPERFKSNTLDNPKRKPQKSSSLLSLAEGTVEATRKLKSDPNKEPTVRKPLNSLTSNKSRKCEQPCSRSDKNLKPKILSADRAKKENPKGTGKTVVSRPKPLGDKENASVQKENTGKPLKDGKFGLRNMKLRQRRAATDTQVPMLRDYQRKKQVS